MSPLSGDAKVINSYLQEFSAAQQIRTQRYKQLEQGFATVLQTHNEQEYKAVMAEITVAFKVCSEAINAAEAGLRELQQLDLADMLRVVQHNEQEKLRLTLILQALRQSSARGQFSWQGSSQAATTDALQSPAESSHSCHCCTAPEPSEAEFSAAKAEAVQGLQIAIENINDVLEEMKYAKEEFEE